MYLCVKEAFFSHLSLLKLKLLEALDSLCADQESVLARLERAGVQGDLGPKLNEEREAEYWLSQEGAPKAKLGNEKPQGETVSYDELIKSWNQ